ncbi:MAG: hypothetical protein AB7S74_18770 [Hyphomicrobium sp.]
MATITDFGSLQTAVVEYLAREGDTTLVARVPTFIQLFEAKMNRDLLVPQMEKRVTATVDINSAEPEFITLPTDFQTMRTVRLNGVPGKPRLQFMTPPQIDDYRYRTDNVTGQPVYLSIFGDELELAPTPNKGYSLEMIYRANIAPLSDSNTTNWLLLKAPDLYLYGTLMESAPYIKEDERIGTWGAGYSMALDGLNALGARQSNDSGPTTVSLPGVTP